MSCETLANRRFGFKGHPLVLVRKDTQVRCCRISLGHWRDPSDVSVSAMAEGRQSQLGERKFIDRGEHVGPACDRSFEAGSARRFRVGVDWIAVIGASLVAHHLECVGPGAADERLFHSQISKCLRVGRLRGFAREGRGRAAGCDVLGSAVAGVFRQARRPAFGNYCAV